MARSLLVFGMDVYQCNRRGVQGLLFITERLMDGQSFLFFLTMMIRCKIQRNQFVHIRTTAVVVADAHP